MITKKQFLALLNEKCIAHSVSGKTVTITGSDVNLYDLRSLPNKVAVKFENGGGVYLDSLTSPFQTYMGRKREFRHIDGYTMLITSKRSQGDFTVCKARYFGGGELDKLNSCYLANSGDEWAHGSTAKAAIEDVQYKLQRTAGREEAIERVQSSQSVTVNDFRIITGACREGMRHHLSQRGIDMEKQENLPLEDALKAMSGSSFGDAFIQAVEAVQ